MAKNTKTASVSFLVFNRHLKRKRFQVKIKFRIAIVGIGGIGGYIGGKLCSFYSNSDKIEILFLSREENATAIKSSGLKLITDNEEIIAYPSIITSSPNELGPVDLFIICVKNYHLQEAVSSLSPAVEKGSKFLPLLNGVSASEKIRSIFPNSDVLDGCIYLVSRLIAPGIVKQTGSVNQLYLGGSTQYEELKNIEHILLGGGLNASHSANIDQICWEKFFFISTIATLTSYLNLSIGRILENESHHSLLVSLMNELKNVAKAKDINLPDDINERTLKKLSAMPYEATSSMHSDFQKGVSSELDAITGYVVNVAAENRVSTPRYNEIFSSLGAKLNYT